MLCYYSALYLATHFFPWVSFPITSSILFPNLHSLWVFLPVQSSLSNSSSCYSSSSNWFAYFPLYFQHQLYHLIHLQLVSCLRKLKTYRVWMLLKVVGCFRSPNYEDNHLNMMLCIKDSGMACKLLGDVSHCLKLEY